MNGARGIAAAAILGLSAIYACSGTTEGSDAGNGDASVPDGSTDLDAQTVGDAPIGPGPILPAACADASAPDDPPQDLLCTGLYSDFATKTLAPGVVPYAPGYVLWSDGAEKHRWIRLPAGAKIDSSNMDEWVFPVGTKAWKEFRLNGKRIETRLFWKISDTASEKWVWATYRWSDDESSARRLDNGETNVGGTTYEVPARAQCKQCHSGRNDRLLGFEAVSLAAPKASGTTLAQLVAQGRLTNAPTSSLLVPNDGSGLAEPALGWLHANCGIACHNGNPDALASGTGLRLRLLTTQLASAKLTDLDTYKTGLGVAALRSDLASQGYQRIKAGDASKSAIPFAAGNRQPGTFVMPPILSRLPDDRALATVRDWINAMPVPDGG